MVLRSMLDYIHKSCVEFMRKHIGVGDLEAEIMCDLAIDVSVIMMLMKNPIPVPIMSNTPITQEKTEFDEEDYWGE